MSPSGFGGNPAGFTGRVKREEFYSSGNNPGRWASSGTDGAFGSGKAPGRWTYGGMSVLEPLEHSVLVTALNGGPKEIACVR